MESAKREALWDAYFNADFRHRYFLELRERLATRIKWLSFVIAALSCGPLVNLLVENGAGAVLGGLGVLAGVIGVYLATSGLPRSLAVAVQAATVWGQAAARLSALWARCESGEDVWAEYLTLDRDMGWIDAVATEHLTTDRKLLDTAWKQSEAAIAHG